MIAIHGADVWLADAEQLQIVIHQMARQKRAVSIRYAFHKFYYTWILALAGGKKWRTIFDWAKKDWARATNKKNMKNSFFFMFVRRRLYVQYAKHCVTRMHHVHVDRHTAYELITVESGTNLTISSRLKRMGWQWFRSIERCVQWNCGNEGFCTYLSQSANKNRIKQHAAFDRSNKVAKDLSVHR